MAAQDCRQAGTAWEVTCQADDSLKFEPLGTYQRCSTPAGWQQPQHPPPGSSEAGESCCAGAGARGWEP